MCGITGFWNLRNDKNEHELTSLVKSMSDEMELRGPDSDGIWVAPEQGVGLGHRRLSIIDLSPAGNQPMVSSCGRFVIVYNGEIYNADDLRKDLQPRNITFRGYSDTEAILESCVAFGVKKTTEKLIGMYAFALWDTEAKTLSLVRDRLGIKPLYWADFEGTLLFSSELKALVKHPVFKKIVDYNAVGSYLRHSYVPAPYSIYQNVYKLRPGEILTRTKNGETQIEAYWSLQEVAQRGQDKQWQGSDEDCLQQLDNLLGDSIKRRMIADVPLGAFLSGGIDSSLVTSLMQANSNQQVRTFSIGFDEQGFNEAHHAKIVAEHLGTDHTELYVTPEIAQSVIPKLPRIFDEPFADSSQIPTYLVSEMTRKHVTVALSGDGGDELFCGYNRYLVSALLGEKIFSCPKMLRYIAATGINALSPNMWDMASHLIPVNRRPQMFGDRLHKLAKVLRGRKDDLFVRMLSQWDEMEKLIRKGTEIQTLLFDESLSERLPNFYDRMQFIDTIMYLPDDILTKVDRASMAVSLEARVPLLDHRVVEFAWSLPHEMKVRNGAGKWALKELLYRYLPQNIVDRPKMGFGVPVGEWIKGPLRDWAEHLLCEEMLEKYQLIQTEEVRKRWKEHLSEKRNWEAGLWNVLMLQSWADEWIK